jgi:DNA-binding beta-propeller fold protein YncE
MKYDTPTLTHSTVTGNSVGTLTRLADSIFIVRNDGKQMEVYDANKLALKRSVKVVGLGAQVYGLVAHDNYLYISDWDNQCVHRVHITDDTTSKWSVGSQPAGLALTPTNNILVTCHGAGKLQEYNTQGSLVSEVRLGEAVHLPWHAVPLSTELFVVSHEGPQHCVSVVGQDGNVIRSYGAAGEMQYPRSIVVDTNKTILVADQCNNRILAINPAMTSAQQLSITVDGGLQWPYGLYLDESQSRLYISEWNGGRLLALDNVKPIEPTNTTAA